MADYEIEISRTIWDNRRGVKSIVVKPDGDSLGLVEIVFKDGTSKVITPDEANLLSIALLATATEIEAAI